MTRISFAIAIATGVLLAAPLGSSRLEAQQGQGDPVPREYRPPPGMCRIWIDSVPPSRQPEATDCPTALRRRPPNARVIFGDDVSRPRGDDRVKSLRPDSDRRQKPQEEKDKDRGKRRVPALFERPRGR